MSCENCENEPLRGAFFRWKNANIELIACKQHWIEVADVLRKYQREVKTDAKDKG